MLRPPFALVWNLLKLLWHGVRRFFFWFGHLLTRKHRKWVRLKLPQTLPFGPIGGLAAHFQDTVSFVQIRKRVRLLADDDRIEGVVVTADQLTAGPGRLGDLRQLIESLRDSGKKVIFHAHNLDKRTYELSAAADEVLLTPSGRLYLFGPRFEQFFANPLLERLGVVPQFINIGPFKTSAHVFTRRQSTDAQKLMMQQLVDELGDLSEERIAEHRGTSQKTLQTCFERAPLDGAEAEARGLVDGRIHRRFLARWIDEGEQFVDTPALAPTSDGDDAGKPPPTPDAEASGIGPGSPADDVADDMPATPETESPKVDIKGANSYADAHPGKFEWTPLFSKRSVIAAVDLTGMIVMPEMKPPGSLRTIDPNRVLPLLRKIADDATVSAVVLHINSPGGSALASEMIWDGIRRLRYQKPTVAYCSDVAASGGYYMAAAADRIVTHPDTVTGSIGVIAGKFSAPGAFEKLDVNTESFHRYDTSAIESIARPLPEEALQNLKRDARAFYRQFLRRVGDARQLPRRRLHRYARGRVYLGQDAFRRFLVDELGGFEDAVELVRSLAEPELPETMKVRFYAHRQLSFPALLRGSTPGFELPSFVADPADRLECVRRIVERDPLLALMPVQINNSRSATTAPVG